MADIDLAAIRARDAETTPYAVREGEYAQCKAAMDDRRALLAEVDRLRAELLLEKRSDNKGFKALEEARVSERARIRAAVEGLPGDEPGWEGSEPVVYRAAVLAAIDGGEPPLGGIEQFQDEDR